MDKNSYLQTPCVNKFVKWMSQHLDDNTFAHQYTNRRAGSVWSCDSLYDAYRKYHWPHSGNQRLGNPPGTDFNSSAATLDALSRDLKSALGSPVNAGQVVTAAVDVMTWGGVRRHNVAWLHTNQTSLPQILLSIRQAINEGSVNHLLTAKDLRFNAGMTKVYSLICDRFVIYDSRVAAALGWAVVKYCQELKLTEIPQELRFPWAPAMGAANDLNPKRRNARQPGLIFPRLVPGAAHAIWNMKASWLLVAVLEHTETQISGFNQIGNFDTRLRALEAALFMIGYDLNALDAGVVATTGGPALKRAAKVEAEAECIWTDCQTLGNGNTFYYRLTENGIVIHKGPKFTLNNISLTLTRLWTDFGPNAFPLSNNAVNVHNDTAPNGMGVAYYQAADGNPPDTSRLAAVLEELGAIIPKPRPPLRPLSWTLNLDRLGFNQDQNQINLVNFWGEVLGAEQES